MTTMTSLADFIGGTTRQTGVVTAYV